ncbi:LolA-like protein [Sulfurospirillum multivorans]|uniref:Periplasmic protein n=2 Tax=Sulfurospirillum multivorans TaxID=66821 RepID=A0AA86AQW3_SULMK|nr:hypothetical protein [Sulfurospirillum multivorans]AHJ14167.1 hypothetical protein SMUL_2931 [Sulfurospirillum multivorans DSM 12446]QEH07652.1 hypothetical protein SMN_2897 [Sulfurospirillum multivorans]
MKVIVLCLVFMLSLFANDASTFKETRYLYALDKNITLEGFITFGEQNIVIEYVKPESKVLTYFEEKLTIQDQNGYKVIDAQSMPSMNYFFLIIKAVHDENSVLLDSFFETTTKGDETLLSPKGVAAEVLEEVRISRQGKKLKSLHVKIKNGDRITIEILD